MKKLAAPLALLFAASVMHAQAPAPAVAPTAKTPLPVVKTPASTTKTTPAKSDLTAKPGTKAKMTKEVKPEVLPNIPGANIARANGTFLGLEIVGGQFKLSFYDKKHKPMAADVTRATARWPNPRAPGDNFTVLNGSGTYMMGQKPVIPPLTFIVRLTLLQGEGDEAKAVENYTVQLSG